MSLRDCLENHTHREFLTMDGWLDEEWNNPSRSDFYMMQNTLYMIREIRGLFTSKVNIKFEHMRLKFDREESKPKSAEQVAMNSKAAWFAAVGYSGPVE